MLQTGQPLPSIGSQAARSGECRRLHRRLLAAAPAGKKHNWLQTVPGKGWWAILRLDNPLAAVLRQDLAAQPDQARLNRR